MNEKQFTAKIGKRIINLIKETALIEYKVVKGDTFNVKQWREKQGHQLFNLVQATTDTGVYHKISDMSRGQKPSDAFIIMNAKSFLVIYFDKYKEFFLFDDLDYLIKNDKLTYQYLKYNYKAYEKM